MFQYTVPKMQDPYVREGTTHADFARSSSSESQDFHEDLVAELEADPDKQMALSGSIGEFSYVLLSR